VSLQPQIWDRQQRLSKPRSLPGSPNSSPAHIFTSLVAENIRTAKGVM